MYRRVSLGALFSFCLVFQGTSKGLDVAWISPLESATYRPGDTILAKWTTIEPVTSPGFSLCEVVDSENLALKYYVDAGGEDDNCGATILPEVQETETGYMVAISVPGILDGSRYSLRMTDGSGHVFSSPTFDFSPSHPVDVNILAGSGPRGIPVDAEANRPLFSADTNSSVSPSPLSQSNISPTGTRSKVLFSQLPASTAEFVIPLSVASGIVLMGGLLYMWAGWKMPKARKEFKSLILSRRSSLEAQQAVGEVGRALSILSKRGVGSHSNSLVPIPAFTPGRQFRTKNTDHYAGLISGAPNNIPELHYRRTSDTRTKSLTDRYTAVGMACGPEDYAVATTTTPLTSLPMRLAPLYIRRDVKPMPFPTRQIFPPAMDVYDLLRAELKRK